MSALLSGHEYDAAVVALVTSPGHSYWHHSKDPADGVGPHATLTHDAVEVVAGQGIAGDRFFGEVSVPISPPPTPTSLSSAVSFVAAEAVEEVARELGATALDPVLMRRNVVTRGIDLNALVGRPFRIGEVECVGRRLAEPCSWLQQMTPPGTLRGLVHRGGLRADILVGGTVSLGDGIEPGE